MSVSSYMYKFAKGIWSFYIEFQANDATALAHGNGLTGITFGLDRNAIAHVHSSASFSYSKGSTTTNILGLLKESPLICHVDIYSLGERFHQSHFILIERISKKRIVIIDPASGKRHYFSLVKLEEAIVSLKKHLKMCPFLFSLS